MRGCQRVVAAQAYPIVSRIAGEADEFVCDGPCNPAISAERGDKHTNHLALPIVEAPNRTGADDFVFGDRAQKEGPIGVLSFCVVDVRQPRIDEVPYKDVRVIMKKTSG